MWKIKFISRLNTLRHTVHVKSCSGCPQESFEVPHDGMPSESDPSTASASTHGRHPASTPVGIPIGIVGRRGIAAIAAEGDIPTASAASLAARMCSSCMRSLLPPKSSVGIIMG